MQDINSFLYTFIQTSSVEDSRKYRDQENRVFGDKKCGQKKRTYTSVKYISNV